MKTRTWIAWAGGLALFLMLAAPGYGKPLLEAAERGDAAAVKRLLEAGAGPWTADDLGRTALHVAAYEGHVQVIEVLLDAGAGLNARDSSGGTALHDAARGGQVAVINLLLEAGADLHAVESNVGNKLYMPIHAAVGKGHLDAVKALVAHGATVEDRTKLGWTPLHAAAAGGPTKIVEDLLALGADPGARTAKGETPLVLAVRPPWVETSRLGAVLALLNAGSNPNERLRKGDTLLHEAAWRGREGEIMVALLEAGGDPNAVNDDGNATPLHFAAFKNRPAVVAPLVAHGADVNARMVEDLTPLHVAAAYNAPEFIAEIVKHGADLEARSALKGRTPLHNAVENARIDAIRVLAEAGADPFATTTDGTNAGMLAYAVRPQRLSRTVMAAVREAMEAWLAQEKKRLTGK